MHAARNISCHIFFEYSLKSPSIHLLAAYPGQGGGGGACSLIRGSMQHQAGMHRVESVILNNENVLGNLYLHLISAEGSFDQLKSVF